MNTISTQGKQFVYSGSNTRFMVRGVAMSATQVLNQKLTPALAFKDILADEHAAFFASQILPQLQYLQANCIRVYQVDPNNSHAITMNNLASAGIYVMVGLATSYDSVSQMTGAYTQSTFVHAARVVDEFQAYDNTFCFSVGNEVEFPGQMASNLQSANPSWSASKVVAATIELEYKVAQAMKSFARDIKAHLVSNNYRSIPVGAAMQDGPEVDWGSGNSVQYQQGLIGTDIIAQYYTAGPAVEIMDFIGINSYRYVTGAVPPANAYVGLAAEAKHLPVPVFLTETGGLPPSPTVRDWADVATLYSTTDQYYLQLSGQIAFQMLEEGAGYGLYVLAKGKDGDTISPQYPTSTADLSVQFTTATTAAATIPAAATTPTVPTSAPTKVTPPGLKHIELRWEKDLLPAKAYTVPNATALVCNYGTSDVLVLQQGGEIGRVAGSATGAPNPVAVQVLAGAPIEILGNTGTATAPTWVALCGLPGSSVIDGVAISTNVTWGSGTTCNTDPLVAVTVKNFSTTNTINVVQNGTVMATVAEAASTTTPSVAAVAVKPGVQILLQGPAPDYASCCQVAATSVTAGITIENDVTWGNGVACTLP